MKKTTIAVLVFVPAALLSSCSVRTTTYAPGYTRDYVSVGVGVRPVNTIGVGVNTWGVGPGYWNNGYYRNVGYWRGYRGYSSIGFGAYRW